MTDKPKPRVFTQGEVNAILSRAVERNAPDGGLAYDELVDVARQAGIDPSAIEAAVVELDEQRPLEREDERVAGEIKARRWSASRGFAIHFTVFVMTTVFLAFVNAQTGGPPWVLFPTLAWAIGLAAHFMVVLFSFVLPDPRRPERIREQLRRRDEWTRRRDEQIRARDERQRRRHEPHGPLAESAKELGVAVQRGMATLLADAAKTIHEEVDRAQQSKRPNVRVEPRTRVGPPEEQLDEDDRDDHSERARRSRR